MTIGMEHNGRRHDRPGQTTAAHFVDTRHIAETSAPQRVLQRPHGRDPHDEP
jgi:hypothetical protein